MVSTHERLEIIVDRRRGTSGSGTNPPSADRRRQPSVDVKVKMDGFAIVPYPPLALAGWPLSTTRGRPGRARVRACPRVQSPTQSPPSPAVGADVARGVDAGRAASHPGADDEGAHESDSSGSATARGIAFGHRDVSLRFLPPTPRPSPVGRYGVPSRRRQPWNGPADRARSRPASPPMRRTNEPVHAAPAPKAVESPAVASPPVEGAGGP